MTELWHYVLGHDEAIARLRWWQVRARGRLMRKQRALLASIRAGNDRRWLQTFADTGGSFVDLRGEVFTIDGPIVIRGNHRVIEAGSVRRLPA